MPDICRRCGDVSSARCEDWKCHEGWGPAPREPIWAAYVAKQLERAFDRLVLARKGRR